MEAVKFDNVSFSYDENVKALDGVNFSVEKGEFAAIVGANGSGKSTIAKLTDALITPASGKITVLGIDACDKSHAFDVRKNVGMVFQNPDNQMVATIVEDDIAFGPENLGVAREEIGERIKFALEATGMSDYLKKPSANLSGGQKQRVAIAGVLAIKPEILILDEATSMLDPKGRDEVMSVVRKLNRENGMTVIAVTHYMEEAAEADRVFVTGSGKILFSGTPREVFSKEKELLDCGLCVPRATYIFNRLKECGVLSGEPTLTKEELKDKLCALFSNI